METRMDGNIDRLADEVLHIRAVNAELLEALTMVVEDFNDRGVTHASINRARAAIRKATGREV